MIVAEQKEHFKTIGAVKFEGPDSNNPLSFKYYQPERIVGNKTMEEHFRFAVGYWHSFVGKGSDPFGKGTITFPWESIKDPIARAKSRMDVAFEFFSKLGVSFYCFHDYDLIDEADSLGESERRLQMITDHALERQQEFGIKPLWGTANLFSNPRYMNGAATNPDFQVVAYAGAQVKQAIDSTIKLGGENYVFWGGREGYLSLLNTDMKRELDHLAQFLHMAKDYARSQGFEGHFFIEPKPMEPTKHQYDFDAATVIGFLREYELIDDFRLNLEVNHATLAQHTFQHEVQVAINAGVLGSMDANRGDYQNGWDTDQFPNNLYELTELMLVLNETDGWQGGGINFDAKLRRNSTDPEDLFFAHIGAMDLFARALLSAECIRQESPFFDMRRQRYTSFDVDHGKDFEEKKLSLKQLHELALTLGEPRRTSGKQELLENIINQYLL